MKRSILLIIILFCAAPLYADISLDPLLNKVSLQLKAEQWVTTQTALVNVNVNAALSDQNIANLQNDVLQKLKQLADGEWHVVNFNRQQDQSGLESIQIMAQARLPQSNLANLRTKAKALSKPGETYTIDNVAFIPSDEELRQSNLSLRNNIYQQVKTEIDALNKIYPDQRFYLHEVDFIFNVAMPMPRNMMFMKATGGEAHAAVEPQAPLNVGNKTELTARVVLAAMPDIVMQKVTALPISGTHQKPQ